MRNGTLDIARLAAAFGIVWFHAGAPGATVGYAALPFFLMLVVHLGWAAARSAPPVAHARERARRLLGPFVLWSALYGALKLIEVAVSGRPLASEFAPHMLLTGLALHLWFLPFAFVVGLALPPLARRGAVPAAPFLAGAITMALWLAAQPLPVPLAQWAFALPGVLAGLAIATGRGGAVAVAGAVGLWAGWPGAGLLLGAAGALGACLALPTHPTALSARAAGCAMGVYLVHPLVLSVLDRAAGLSAVPLLHAAAACAASFLAVLLWEALRPDMSVRRRSTELPGTRHNIGNPV